MENSERETKIEQRVEFWRTHLCPEMRVAVMRTEPPADRAPDTDSWVAFVHSNLAISEATIYFKESIHDLDQVHQDRIIVHELIHPMLDRVLDLEEPIQLYVPMAAWNVYQDLKRGEMEEFVNRMAHAIVDTYHRRQSFVTETCNDWTP